MLKRENLARKAKYQNQWADTESETSASAKESPNNPTSASDSDADGSLSDFVSSNISENKVLTDKRSCLYFIYFCRIMAQIL